MATVFGSLQSYLQSGGRLLRSHPGLESVSIQDHGGNWHRHGSLNADRIWSLDLTEVSAYGLRADEFRSGRPEPFRCQECSKIIHRLPCPCGWNPKKLRLSRPVVTTEGELVQLEGYQAKVFKTRRKSQAPNGPALWERMYWRSRTEKGQRTFKQAMALFARENHFSWPDEKWPFMPKEPMDFYELVSEVPMDRLVPKGECHENVPVPSVSESDA